MLALAASRIRSSLDSEYERLGEAARDIVTADLEVSIPFPLQGAEEALHAFLMAALVVFGGWFDLNMT
ncbi:hypothetical protein [Methylobacterium brachythecii]|uniref:Uncharacterized protein n=1 Tax=Methylobacterium brachythecii TaxID=1176177 RepID=A0A7W6AN75_9HYPH|nr:hypothetical protein [Methylobacterium brachythecii]MBB3905696.1 hypothetical protein [Methylobacterium brachythecii]GLS47040.1 hypothetical protein GCM10007884_50410 [Methylobacterium brachythecii]